MPPLCTNGFRVFSTAFMVQVFDKPSPPQLKELFTLIHDGIRFLFQPFHSEVEAKRQSINELEKNSLEHKSNSDKQEMAMIKNLVLDIKHRYEEIVRKARDHNKRLEDGVKRARQVSALILLHDICLRKIDRSIVLQASLWFLAG